MKCMLDTDIFVLDMKVFIDTSADISRTTVSINQIAKRINSASVIYKDDYEFEKDSVKSYNN